MANTLNPNTDRNLQWKLSYRANMLWLCYQLVSARTFFYDSFVILKDTSDPNQTQSIVVIVLCRIIIEDQIRSNDYLWVVAFEKKGNLLKDMCLFSFKTNARGSRKIHCQTGEFQSKFHSKSRYRFVIYGISVFSVKCTVEFTSQAMNFSIEESKENDTIYIY